MNYKNKLLLLTILLGCFSNIFATNKGDSELIVSGENIWERVDYTIGIDKDGKDYYLDGGEDPMKAALWADNKSTVHNIGNIMSGEQKYNSQFGAILGIGWVNNELEKTDNLVVLRGGATLLNDGKISMGTINHYAQSVLEVADLGFYRWYADYKKNVINSENSNIYNSGVIESKGDKFSFESYVTVSLLKYNDTMYTKNVINMNGGYLENSGIIQYGRDEKAQVFKAVGVDLLGLGVHYNRITTSVNVTNGTVVNDIGGKISTLGDLYISDNYSGITVEALGASLVGSHAKYGIQGKNSTIINRGLIEVERDFKMGKEENGNGILDLILILPTDFLKLGLLSIDNTYEKSVGVSLSGGSFTNDGGTIKVGSNQPGKNIEVTKMESIGIESFSGAKIEFKGNSTVELEGTNIHLGKISDSSTMVFKGNTDIFYQTAEKLDNGTYKYSGNTDIFYNDSTSKYIVYGKLNIDGKTPIIGAGTSNPSGENKFNADLTISNGNNIYIGIDDVVVKEDDPNTSDKDETEIKKQFGTITASGKIDINSQIKVDGKSIYDNWKYFTQDPNNEFKINVGDTVLVGKKGINGSTNIGDSEAITIESGSYMYEVNSTYHNPSGTEEDTVTIDSITRKDMRDIVKNSELGNILEESFNGASLGQSEVYRYLASGEDKEQFENRITEITGRDTLTTLNSQIYDITKDLNKQFKGFAKSNTDDGVVFKYINSESELGANSSTVGFERKSSGIMVGYNNYISEKLRLGAGFSYMKSDIDYTSASSNDVTTWNFRGYSDYDLGFANIFSDLSFGYNQSENKRLSEGVDSTGLKEGDLDVYSLSFNNSLYKNYQINNKLSLTTSLNLDFTYLYQEDYEETGIFSASSESTDAFYVTAGLGVDGKYNLISFGNSKINLVAGIEYAYDIVSNTEKTKIKMKDFDVYHEEIRELDKKSLTYDIGLNYEYSDRYSVGAKYTKELINDIDNDQVGIDFTYKF